MPAVDPHGTSVTDKDGGAGASGNFIQQHKMVFIIGGGIVALLGVYFFMKQSSTSGATTPVNAANNLGSSGAQDAGTATALNDMQSQFNQLQKAIADAAAASSGNTIQTPTGPFPGPPPPIPNPSPSGGNDNTVINPGPPGPPPGTPFCPAGFHQLGFACIPDFIPPVPVPVGGVKEIMCRPGNHRVGLVCVPDTPPKEIMCRPGYHRVGTLCVTDVSQGSHLPLPKPTNMVSIRARGSLSAASAYDKNTPGGVPLRSSPGGTQIGTLHFGSAVPVIGALSSGPNNLGTHAAGGSTQWEHVQGGYVSLEDIGR